jgi:cytochrome c biogenesis factor
MATARELDHQYRMRRLQVLSQAWNSLLTFLGIAAICVCVYFSIRELAGRTTFADLRFKVLADLKANRWLAMCLSWGLATTSTGWALGERYLRKRHIQRISSETSEMQKLLDPSRRSSSLSKEGNTSSEDI